MKKKHGWCLGDVRDSDTPIPENASAVIVDPSIHYTNEMQVIVSGGFLNEFIDTRVFGLNFSLEEVNAVDEYSASVSCHLHPLTIQRACHQSAIAKGKNGSWSLFVLGGKADKDNWLSSVEVLDLLPYFRPG